MPVFELYRGWSMVIYLNDHRPPHIHAKKAGDSVRVWLDDCACEVERGKVSPAELARIKEFVRRNKAKIERYWNELHGC